MGKNERPSLGEITQRLVNLVVLRELTRRVQRWKAQDAANRRALRIVLPLVVITIVSATGYALWTIAERKHQAARLAACGEGYESARQGRVSGELPSPCEHLRGVDYVLGTCVGVAGPLGPAG